MATMATVGSRGKRRIFASMRTSCVAGGVRCKGWCRKQRLAFVSLCLHNHRMIPSSPEASEETEEVPEATPEEVPAEVLEDSPEETLDTRGLICPLPVLKARKQLQTLVSGTILRIVSDDPGSLKDFQHFCKEQHHHLLTQHTNNTTLVHRIRKG